MSLIQIVAKLGICLLFSGALMVGSQTAMAQDDPVGHIIIATSELKAIGGSAGERLLKRRSPVYQGDTLITGVGGKAQVRFIDGTIMTLMADTSFRVDKYSMQARGDDRNAVSTSLIKGGLRSITGSIAKQSPEAFKVETDIATIGIRGTDFGVLKIQGKREGVFYWASKDTVVGSNENGSLCAGVGCATDHVFVSKDDGFQPVSDEQASAIMTGLGLVDNSEDFGDFFAELTDPDGDGYGGGDFGDPPNLIVDLVDQWHSVGEDVADFLQPTTGLTGSKTYSNDFASTGAGAMVGVRKVMIGPITVSNPYVLTYNLNNINWAGGFTVNFDNNTMTQTNNIKFNVNEVNSFAGVGFKTFTGGTFEVTSNVFNVPTGDLLDNTVALVIPVSGIWNPSDSGAGLSLPSSTFSGAITGGVFTLDSLGDNVTGVYGVASTDTTGVTTAIGGLTGTFTVKE